MPATPDRGQPGAGQRDADHNPADRRHPDLVPTKPCATTSTTPRTSIEATEPTKMGPIRDRPMRTWLYPSPSSPQVLLPLSSLTPRGTIRRSLTLGELGVCCVKFFLKCRGVFRCQLSAWFERLNSTFLFSAVARRPMDSHPPPLPGISHRTCESVLLRHFFK